MIQSGQGRVIMYGYNIGSSVGIMEHQMEATIFLYINNYYRHSGNENGNYRSPTYFFKSFARGCGLLLDLSDNSGAQGPRCTRSCKRIWGLLYMVDALNRGNPNTDLKILQSLLLGPPKWYPSFR